MALNITQLMVGLGPKSRTHSAGSIPWETLSSNRTENGKQIKIKRRVRQNKGQRKPKKLTKDKFYVKGLTFLTIILDLLSIHRCLI